MPLLQKTKQNEIFNNLEEPDEINESTAINLQPLPSQARRKTTTAAILCKCLKEVKDLSYSAENEDTLGETLGYLANIRGLMLGAAPNESCISLEPTKGGSK